MVERNEPYMELEKRNKALPSGPGDSDDGNTWKGDIERGNLGGEFIFKTVTIDLTCRSKVRSLRWIDDAMVSCLRQGFIDHKIYQKDY